MQQGPSYRSPRTQAHAHTELGHIGPGPGIYMYAQSQPHAYQPQYPPQQQQPHQQFYASPPRYAHPHYAHEDPQREEKQALTIASLQSQILAMTKELSATASELSQVSAESVLLGRSNAEQAEKLDVTRAALRETRDSLEQVQTVIKPLALAQKNKDQQLQQLTAVNAALEARLADHEAKMRQAEVTIRQHVQRQEAMRGDEGLIDKLHEKLVASQDALVKTQNELQRLQVVQAGSSSELGDARRKLGALEVQLLMQTQAHTQALQSKKDECAARENSLTVELQAARRRMAALEEQVSVATSLREAERVEEEKEKRTALEQEIRAALARMGAGGGSAEGNREVLGQLQLQSQRLSSGAPESSPVAANDSKSPSSSPSSVYKYLSAGRKPPVPQAPPPGKAKSSSPYSLSFYGGYGSSSSGAVSPESSPESGAVPGAPQAGRGAPSVAQTVLAGGTPLRVDQVLNLALSSHDGGSPGRPDSPDLNSSSDEVNMPIFFRPLGDIEDEVRRLEGDRDKAVRAIKEWTDGFVRSHGREPGAQDISASPAVKGLYNEIAEVGIADALLLPARLLPLSTADQTSPLLFLTHPLTLMPSDADRLTLTILTLTLTTH